MVEPECMDGRLPFSATRLYEESITSLERELDTYSKLVVACNKRVQMMHSVAFNNEQCQYLVDTLNEVTKSSSFFLETSQGAFIGLDALTELENHLFIFKLLLVLASEIERFIEGCSKDAWVPAAMILTNSSEFVSSIGFHLELCRVALSKKCGVLEGLNLNQVADISNNVNEIVKTKASMDTTGLLKKISLTLPSLHGDEKDLAHYLLQRLLRVAVIPNIPLSESKWDFSRYLTFLKSIFEKVKQEKSIGKGASATVFKAMWLEMEVAVKVFYGENNPEFKKEVDVLARLCHPNITSMFCCSQDIRKCSIVMELMDGDLFALMQQRLEVKHDSPPFNIWEAVDIMHQIAEGGKYLHEQDIVHRDLKSLNILVASVKTVGADLEHIQAKVADFNVSKIKKNSTTNSEQTKNVGSNRWMAPELIRLSRMDNQMNVGMSNQSEPKHPHKCDIYSFAMVCYEILSGKLPFPAYSEDEPRKMKTMILEGDRPELPAHCPSNLRDLIEKCWSSEPKCRPTFDDVCRELKYVKYLLMAGTSRASKIQDTSEKGQMERGSNLSLKDKCDRLEDIHKIDDQFSNIAITMGKPVEVGRITNKSIDALEDFNKTDELQSNDAFTLKNRGEAKRMMGKNVDALEDFNKADELQPNDTFTLKNRGEVKRMMGRYANALEDFNRVNELQPNDAFILKNRGEAKRMMGKNADALEDFNRADELQPNDAFILKNRGEAKRMMGKYEDALEDFNKADEIQPNDAFILKNRGEAKRMMGKNADALEDFNRADELQPNDAFILKNRGEAKRMMGKNADALEDFNKADELQPNDAFILKNRGEAKRMMGKNADALEDFNKANELQPNDAFILKNRGEAKRMMGKYEDALEDFNKADELQPNDAFILTVRGEAKRMMARYVDALVDFNKADELQPNDAFILRNRGEAKRAMGMNTDALADFNRADKLQPNDAFILRNRGEAKRAMGMNADALVDFNKADELQPNDAFILRNRGEAKRAMGMNADALEDFNRADELTPNDAFILRNRGEAKRMMGRYVDALADFNRADELTPNDAFILRNRGETKRMMGRFVDALADFNRANELQPYDSFILSNRQKTKQAMGENADVV